VLGERPTVRLNQLGFLPDAPKRATLVTEREEPIPFRVLACSGEVLAEGRSQPWRPRPEGSSGLAVHVLDFSALAAVGSGCASRSAISAATRSAWPTMSTPSSPPTRCGSST
jgi:endoglucanase